MFPVRKEAANIILSKLKKDGSGTREAEVKNEASVGEPSARKMIAEDMMMAFKSGSVSDLETALDALVGQIQTEDAEQDAETEDDEIE